MRDAMFGLRECQGAIASELAAHTRVELRRADQRRAEVTETDDRARPAKIAAEDAKSDAVTRWDGTPGRCGRLGAATIWRGARPPPGLQREAFPRPAREATGL